MNNIDYCIEKYLADHFECPDLVFFLRDCGIEEKFIDAGKIEYILRSDIAIFEDLFGYDPKYFGIHIDSNGAIYKPQYQEKWQSAQYELQEKLKQKEYPCLYNFFSLELISLYQSIDIEILKKNKLLYGLFNRVGILKEKVSVNNEQGESICNSFSIPSEYFNDVDKFFPKIEETELLAVRSNIAYIFNNTLVASANNKKIVLPFCRIPSREASSKHQGFRLPFWPSESYPLQGFKFDLGYLCRPEYRNRKIILTDSMEIAIFNQQGLVKSNNNEILWLYWHGGKEVIPNVDLEPLKGRIVYYMLIKHSGLREEQVFETGECIEERLNLIGAKELKFISYMHMHSSVEKDIVPRVFSSIHEVRTELKYNIPCLKKIQKQYVSKIQNRKAIVTPVILDRTFTIAYGAKSVLNTWFVQLLGLSGLLGRRAIEDWDCKQKAKKLIFCYKDEYFSTDHYLENIDFMFRVLTGRKPIKNKYGDKLKSSDYLTKNSVELHSLRNVNDASAFILESTREPKILVLDGFEIDPYELVDIESTIRALIRSGWTVILSIQTSKHFDSAKVRKISADSYLEIKQLNFSQNKLTFSVSTDTILRAFKRPNSFRCEFDFGFDPPTLRKLPLSKSELEALRNEIFSMRAREVSWREISRTLDISINKATRFSPGKIDRL